MTETGSSQERKALKRRIRREVLAVRDALSEEALRRASCLITERLLVHFVLPGPLQVPGIGRQYSPGILLQGVCRMAERFVLLLRGQALQLIFGRHGPLSHFF